MTEKKHLPKQAHRNMSCPCGSGKLFSKCCQRFLLGEAVAATPKQLMRSRYSAYALGGCGDYLLATWFPATAEGLTAESLSEKTVEWLGLEVLASSQKGDRGSVEFNAVYREPDEEGAHTLHEVSVFQRSAGRWLYVGGELSRSPLSSTPLK